MVAWDKKKTGDLLLLFNGILLAVVLNQLAALYSFRVDLTEEKRYTIKEPTVALLQQLDDDVYVDVYLEGELNAEFRRLRKAVRETLEEFRVRSGNRVHYQFSDPLAAAGANARQEFMADLVSKGLKPLNIIDSKDGRRTENIVFPGALVSFGGLQTGVMLLKDQVGGAQQDINRAIEGLEFELANAIHQLTVTDRKRVGFVTGHQELDSLQVSALREALAALYDVNLNVRLSRPLAKSDYDVLVVAKPQAAFSEAEKYTLDQYLMSGGNLVFLLDALRVNLDSVASGDYYAFPYQLGLEDMLFRYGVRLNPDLVQDLVSLRYPVVTGQLNGKPQITPIEWLYFPLVNQYAAHPVTRNLDATMLRFSGSLDSVKAVGVKKTPLLFSSNYSRRVSAPLKINVNDLRKEITPQNFSTAQIPVAYLLEGTFRSLYENRFLPDGVSEAGRQNLSPATRVVVVADGDIGRNEFNRRTGQPVELGFDAVSNHTFANRELLMNLVAFLTDESGLITTRTKEIRVRPLDKEKVRESRTYWQFVNLGAPLLLLIALGLSKAYLRHRRYGRFQLSTQPHGSATE
ncbi:MAG: gliding motility-associated ABC transporter substrate-binding protein GldG [Cyclobacteriaceae bacterium]|nr:gliding motility-associated ABC transporter substrate-binding protein GldG [Cyclobacteriaceae bacterium]